MTDNYSRLMKLANEDTVKLAEGFRELMHKELVLGQTRWVCRYGTLSEGHEKITPAQRYYQAIREMYVLAGSIRQNKALAMEAQADLAEAIEDTKIAESNTSILRAKARIIMADQRLINLLVTVEDQTRMLDEYNKIRIELQDSVRHQYPEGIEQAEQDSWQAVLEYRLSRQASGTRESFQNIPLPAEIKAAYAINCDKPELAAWYTVAEKDKLPLYNNDAQKMIKSELTKDGLDGKNVRTQIRKR